MCEASGCVGNPAPLGVLNVLMRAKVGILNVVNAAALKLECAAEIPPGDTHFFNVQFITRCRVNSAHIRQPCPNPDMA